MNVTGFCKRSIWLFSLLLFCSNAFAFKPVCEQIFSDKFLSTEISPQTSEQTLKNILSAMDVYKSVMGFEKIDQKPGSLDQAKLKFRNLDKQNQDRLLELASEIYNDVKLLKYNKQGPVKFFKRHLDIIISEQINARRLFKKMIIDQGRTIEEALSEYFKQVNQYTKTPTRLEGHDVLLTAMRLQEHFLQNQSHQAPIILYGSFVNGKAYEKLSDLDFSVTDGIIEQSMRETDLLKMLEDFPLSEAQAHISGKNQINGLGYLNQLVILVYKDHIILRVYPNLLTNQYKGKNVQFDDYYL